jgi:hypothetical protein
MKKIILTLVVLLSGCSFIMPIQHDPVMFGNLVEVKVAVDKLTCEPKDPVAWDDASAKIQKLAVYSDLRGDPQSKSISQLQEAISKARDSKSKMLCEGVLKINKTRIDIVADAWKGR